MTSAHWNHLSLCGLAPAGAAEDANAARPDRPTGTSVADLVTALQSVPFLRVGEVKTAEISGNYAISVDVTVDPGAQAACGGFGTEGRALFPVAEDEWSAVPGEVFRLRAVDVDATTVAFIVSAESAIASAVVELEQFLARAERIIARAEF